MKPLHPDTAFSASFIGFGLIGGSIAKALKKSCPDCRLLAYDYYSDASFQAEKNDTRDSSLLKALSDGILDKIETTLSPELTESQVIFLCAPVLTNISYLTRLKPLIAPHTVLTDVGSVKGNIYEAVKQLHMEDNFIGGHPMTGSEKSGYENADARLLENAYYILTPTKGSSPKALSFLKALVAAMGALPVVMDFDEHDNILSAISHVPHIIATSLVNMVRNSDDEENHMFSLAAGGFKDITRIASASPVMWQNICLTNRDGITSFLDRYIGELSYMKTLVAGQKESELLEAFQTAKDYRDSIPKRRINAPERIYELYLDIIDEAGAIASIATLLASNGISIKNIGILHNREFEEGVLHMEFYEDTAVENAAALLTKHHYTIYQR